jgi:hypothetical protein
VVPSYILLDWHLVSLLFHNILTPVSVDPETKAEFEEMQKSNPLTGGAGASNPAAQLQNFDLASWMAGKTTDTPATNKRGASPNPQGKKRG